MIQRATPTVLGVLPQTNSARVELVAEALIQADNGPQIFLQSHFDFHPTILRWPQAVQDHRLRSPPFSLA